MKIVLVNTSDQTGGAAIACLRLANALQAQNAEVTVLVAEKKSRFPIAISIFKDAWDKKVFKFLQAIEYSYFKKYICNETNIQFSDNFLGYDLTLQPKIAEADVINLHWINHGLMNAVSIKRLFALKKPIIWHLHDMWAFTGGCHYAGECTNYKTECNTCPALKKSGKTDRSNVQWKWKKLLFDTYKPTIITPSNWLASLAKNSSLFENCNIEVIPNPIDAQFYAPYKKEIAREILALPKHKKLLLFVAFNTQDPRKGMQLLIDALQLIDPKTIVESELVILGKANPEALASIKMKKHFLGYQTDPEKIKAAYVASDAFIIPSLEDNLPNTVMESLACGTPVIGFNTGGIPEMVNHLQNGLIASETTSKALAVSISDFLKLDDASKLSENARTKVLSTFSNEIIAQKYLTLFSNVAAKA